MRSLRIILQGLKLCEDALLILALMAMIGTGILQILLRNLFDTGILWGDSLLRALVLWITLAGAMATTRDGRHIRIELITQIWSGWRLRLAEVVISLFAAVICGLAAKFSLDFVSFEYQDGFPAFAAVPAWVVGAVIPFGFGIMSLRFLLQAAFPLPREQSQ